MIFRINLVQYSSKFGNSQQQFTVTDGGCKHYNLQIQKNGYGNGYVKNSGYGIQL